MCIPPFMMLWQKHFVKGGERSKENSCTTHTVSGSDEGDSIGGRGSHVVSGYFLASYPDFYQLVADDLPLVLEETRASSVYSTKTRSLHSLCPGSWSRSTTLFLPMIYDATQGAT